MLLQAGLISGDNQAGTEKYYVHLLKYKHTNLKYTMVPCIKMFIMYANKYTTNYTGCIIPGNKFLVFEQI